MRRIGFSMTELMIVIGVVLALAIILVPFLLSNRPLTDVHHPREETNTCLNNQRQIAIALMMYVQDNSEKYFPNSLTQSWAMNLKNYNEPSIYDCPTLTGAASNINPEYGFNGALFGQQLGNIMQPSSTLSTGDLKTTCMGGSYAFNGIASSPKYVDNALDPRHSNAVILSCVDGHVTVETFPAGGGISGTLKSRGYALSASGK